MEISDKAVEKPKKTLLDYKGFIKAKYDPEAEREAVASGLLAHVMGQEEEEG